MWPGAVDAEMTAHGGLDRARIRDLHGGELARFRDARPATLALLERASRHMPNGTPMSWMAIYNEQPIYVDHGDGSGFTDVDGFFYLDFNASDMAMFCGHAHPLDCPRDQGPGRALDAVSPPDGGVGRGRRGACQTLSGQHVAVHVVGKPANTEAIRLARAVTGREVIVLFQGHYHGHFEEGVVDLVDEHVAALERGLSKGVTGRVRIAQFNDPDNLRVTLRARGRGLGADRACDDEPRSPAYTRTGLARRTPSSDDRIRHASGPRRDAHSRRPPGRSDRAMESRTRHGHHRQGRGRWCADGRLRRSIRTR